MSESAGTSPSTSIDLDRRSFLTRSTALGGLGGLLALGSAAFSHATSAAPPAKPPTATRPPAPLDGHPVLHAPSSTGITIIQCVTTNATAWVEYGTTRELGIRADPSLHGLFPLNGRVHRIALEGLTPATRYFYRVVVAPIDFRSAYRITRGPEVRSEIREFVTLDGGVGEQARMVILNDTHENPDTIAGIVSVLTADRLSGARAPDLLFWNGDIFNDVRNDQQIVDQLVKPAGAFAHASTTPLCFVSGNHDVRGIHARSIDHFIAVPGGRRFHLFRQGPVAALVLDTGEDKDDGHGGYAGLNDFARYRDAQRTWLAEAVTQPVFRDAPFRVAIMHIPLFGKASSADARAKWMPILTEARLDLAIHGHVHEQSLEGPTTDRPFTQLVGGGPHPDHATVIDLEANSRSMVVRVRDLLGREKARVPMVRRA